MGDRFLDTLQQKAKAAKKRIILPESTEQRTLTAACELKSRGIAQPLLLGDADLIAKKAHEFGLTREALGNIEIVPMSAERVERYGLEYHGLVRAKGISEDEARREMEDPLAFAAMTVRMGQADGYVAGALNSTANVLRPAIRTFGTLPGFTRVSSFFLMSFADERGQWIFADCAVIPVPTSTQLAEIAQLAAENTRLFLDRDPKVALLSFSTKGSADHAESRRVAEAAATLAVRAPNLVADGELQADAAIVESVGRRKAPASAVAGHANTLIFPDLNSGNISCKLVERMAGAAAIGPILQGLHAPANDLSRGCSTEDIVNVAAITAIQAENSQRSTADDRRPL